MYDALAKLEKEEPKYRVQSLLYNMGMPESKRIMDSFALSEADAVKFATVVAAFDRYFTPHRNIVHERAVFHQRHQKKGETVESYVSALRDLAQHCKFKDVEDQIRDVFIIGLLDKECSMQIQLLPSEKCTLQDATGLARQYEMVKAQLNNPVQQVVKTEDEELIGRVEGQDTEEVNRVQAKTRTKKTVMQQTQKCSYCGSEHERGKRHCPASEKICGKCGKKNHFAAMCKNPVSAHTVFLGSINGGTERLKPWHANLNLRGKNINFKIDTGADVTVMSHASYQSLGTRLMPSNIKMKSASGPLTCLGYFNAHVKRAGRQHTLQVYVVEELDVNLLGRDDAVQLQLVKRLDRVLKADSVGKLECLPVKIHLKEDAHPYSVHTARRVALPLLPAVKKELNRMLEDDVIEKVTEPSEWCAPLVPVVKNKGGKEEPEVRLCIDFKKLNRAIKRERYVMPTCEELLAKLSGNKVFSLLDAAAGFWQLPLEEDSRRLTTFITPFGRFRMKRLPFGIATAPEIFQERMEDLLQGCDGTVCYMDDILVFGKTAEEHNENLKRVLKRLQERGLMLNEAKCKCNQSRVRYLGFVVSEDGIRIDPDKISAIQELKPPTCVTELKRILGMLNYVGRFVPQLSEELRPLNALLRKDQAWQWEASQEEALKKAKNAVTRAPVLALYNPELPTTISADASSYGLGGVILQETSDGLHPVAFCSRTLTPGEQKYAQIEKECLALTWVCERFHQYLHGMKTVQLLTDHKPLVPLVNDKDLDTSPIRCQRLLMRLMQYNVEAVYCPGKNMLISDLLSRDPMKNRDRKAQQEELEEAVECYASSVIAHMDPSTDRLKQAQEDDDVLTEVKKHTLEGWPSTDEVSEAAQVYMSSQDHLSVVDSILLFDDRMVVPEKLRQETLIKIHEGHLGLHKSREAARTSVWWPGLSTDLKKMIESCEFCQVNRPRQRSEPLLPTSLPEGPWQKLGADILMWKQSSYLVIVDYYSRYLEILDLPNITSSMVIRKMKATFARHGLPCEVVTDGGTQFTSSEFADFSMKYNFHHHVTSPHHPQSNGEAERAVRTAKHVLRQKDPCMALLAYRNAPLHGQAYSPAQLLMGRRLRTTLPTLSHHMKPQLPDHEEMGQRDRKHQK